MSCGFFHKYIFVERGVSRAESRIVACQGLFVYGLGMLVHFITSNLPRESTLFVIPDLIGNPVRDARAASAAIWGTTFRSWIPAFGLVEKASSDVIPTRNEEESAFRRPQFVLRKQISRFARNDVPHRLGLFQQALSRE